MLKRKVFKMRIYKASRMLKQKESAIEQANTV